MLAFLLVIVFVSTLAQQPGSSTSSPNTNLGWIIGVSVGVGVCVLIIVSSLVAWLIFVRWRKRQAKFKNRTQGYLKGGTTTLSPFPTNLHCPVLVSQQAVFAPPPHVTAAAGRVLRSARAIPVVNPGLYYSDWMLTPGGPSGVPGTSSTEDPVEYQSYIVAPPAPTGEISPWVQVGQPADDYSLADHSPPAELQSSAPRKFQYPPLADAKAHEPIVSPPVQHRGIPVYRRHVMLRGPPCRNQQGVYGPHRRLSPAYARARVRSSSGPVRPLAEYAPPRYSGNRMRTGLRRPLGPRQPAVLPASQPLPYDCDGDPVHDLREFQHSCTDVRCVREYVHPFSRHFTKTSQAAAVSPTASHRSLDYRMQMDTLTDVVDLNHHHSRSRSRSPTSTRFGDVDYNRSPSPRNWMSNPLQDRSSFRDQVFKSFALSDVDALTDPGTPFVVNPSDRKFPLSPY